MARLYRLLAPGLSFTLLGLLVLGQGRWNWLHLHGALLTAGLYALALQIVLSALLTSAIDDLSGGGLWHLAGRGSGELVRISTRPIGFSRALVEFYRRPFWPAFLFGFGLGASLSAIVVAALGDNTFSYPYDYLFRSVGMHKSEGTLGVVLLVGAALLWWRGDRAYFGWTIGWCLATALGQVVFVPYTNVVQTTESWSGVAAGLCVLRLLGFGIARARKARLRSGPAGSDQPSLVHH